MKSVIDFSTEKCIHSRQRSSHRNLTSQSFIKKQQNSFIITFRFRLSYERLSWWLNHSIFHVCFFIRLKEQFQIITELFLFFYFENSTLFRRRAILEACCHAIINAHGALFSEHLMLSFFFIYHTIEKMYGTKRQTISTLRMFSKKKLNYKS